MFSLEDFNTLKYIFKIPSLTKVLLSMSTRHEKMCFVMHTYIQMYRIAENDFETGELQSQISRSTTLYFHFEIVSVLHTIRKISQLKNRNNAI